MLKNYFKQAWTLMRQNRLFTGIYVVGTGLSIALVMTLFGDDAVHHLLRQVRARLPRV